MWVQRSFLFGVHLEKNSLFQNINNAHCLGVTLFIKFHSHFKFLSHICACACKCVCWWEGVGVCAYV